MNDQMDVKAEMMDGCTVDGLSCGVQCFGAASPLALPGAAFTPQSALF